MAYPVLWDIDRVTTIFTTESRQKPREAFLQTHRPFQRIRVDFCKEKDSPNSFITEEQLRTVVQMGPLSANNRLFFLVGEAGSGKSELCQWLEYAVDQSRCIPVHVPRSMTNAAHVTALLRQKLEGDVAFPVLHRVPLLTQSEHVMLSTLVILLQQGSSILTPAHTWFSFLRGDEFRVEILRYLEAVRTEKSPLRIFDNEAQVEAICASHGVELLPDQVQLACAELRRLTTLALERTLWLGDLHELLVQLSTQSVQLGKRPLLLIEDITAFQILGDQLLDYLLDLTSGHFDAVIGVTTGFERTRLAGATLDGDLTHIHHRLQGRFTLTDELGRSYGFEEDLLEFTRTYLQAVQLANENENRDSKNAMAFGFGLYPFTKIALIRAFHALQEEGNPKQTPRLFLEHVLRPVMLSKDIPPLVLDRSNFLLQPPALFQSQDVADPALHSLLRWYGEIENETVTLDIEIAQMWDIFVPPNFIKDNLVIVPRTYVDMSRQILDDVHDWHGEIREFQKWITQGGLYPRRETLKRGIERSILALGDPRTLSNPHSQSLSKAELYYARGDERLPIMLGRDSGDQPSTEAYVKVEVMGLPGERSILEEMIYLALSDANISSVCRNVALTLEWSQQHWNSYRDHVSNLFLNRLGGVDVEQLVWVGWSLVNTLTGTAWDNVSNVTVKATRYKSHTEVSPWSPGQHLACFAAGESLRQWHETWRRLFIGMFMLHDTMFDQERLSAVRNRTNPTEVVNRLAHLTLARVRSLPIKIRPSGENFPELIGALHQYALALVKLDVITNFQSDQDELAKRESHLQHQLNLDMGELQEVLLELRWRCGEVGVSWRESWDSITDSLRNCTSADLKDLLTQVRDLRSMARALNSRRILDIWEYQTFRLEFAKITCHPYWSALGQIRQIQDELLGRAKVRYRDVGKHLSSTRHYRNMLQSLRAVWKEIGND